MAIQDPTSTAMISALTVPSANRAAPSSVRAAGMVAAALLLAVAAFQIALALGARWGAHAYGGRAATPDGALPTGYRVASLATAPLLAVGAWVLLARSGVVDGRQISDVALGRATWAVTAFTALNTFGNLASTSPIERWGLGAVTATVSALGWLVARSDDRAR